MDARTVAGAAGIGTGTVNVWIQRSLVPGMSIGIRGKQRDFDVETAVHIAIMARLVRLGLGAPFASYIAGHRRQHKRLIAAHSPGSPLNLGDATFAGVREIAKHFASSPDPSAMFGTTAAIMASAVPVVGFDTDAELPEALAKFPGGRPAVYVVIDVEQIRNRMIHLNESRQEGR